MLVAGAGGFAKELIELIDPEDMQHLRFFDNINDIDLLFERFPVIHTPDEVKKFFQLFGNKFVLGIGASASRKKLDELLTSYGGVAISLLSHRAEIGTYHNQIGEGVNIMSGSIITNNIRIGRGSLINLHCSICHDSTIGEYCTLSPGVRISGNCEIGNFCEIGTNSAILPGVSVCSNSIIGAGAVVTKNITEPGTYVGIPAKKIK